MHILKKLLIFLPCLSPAYLCILPKLSAQQLPVNFQHYTTRDGLGATIIFNIVQDRMGYLWVSHSSGVDRFDGNSFRHFQHDDKDPYSLPFERCNITTDPSGNVWVYGDPGLAFFDAASDRFLPIPIQTIPGESKVVSAVCWGRDGLIWIGADDGYLRMIDFRKRIINKVCRFTTERINVLNEDGPGRLWIATDAGLRLFDENSRNSTCYKDSARDAVNDITTIFRDSRHRLWLTTMGGGFKEFHPGTGTFDVYKFNPDPASAVANYAFRIIQPVTQNSSEDLWIVSADNNIGITIFNPVTRQFRYINHDKENPASPANNASVSIFQDKSGIIWYGNESGLDKYDPHENRFPEINLNSIPGMPKDAGITALNVHDSVIWIGISGEGIGSYNLRNYKAGPLLNLAKLTGDGLSNVTNCFYREGEKLWIGTSSGLFLFDTNNGSVREEALFRHMQVNSMARFTDGWFAIGTSEGIKITDSNRRSIYTTILSNTTVFKLLTTPDGNVLAGTAGAGLYWITLKLQLVHVLGGNNAAWRLLEEARIYDVALDKNGDLLLATTKGAARLTLRTSDLRFITPGNGLASPICYRIMPGDDGLVWVGHNKGLSAIDFTTGRLKNYGVQDGLLSPTFENSGLEKGEDGTIYFGRYISIYAFRSKTILRNNQQSPLYITGLRADDSLLHPGATPVRLSYKHRSIGFEYVLLNFSNTAGNTYEYKLEGLEDQWNNAGNRRFVTYSNLKPGTYTFRVRARNSDDVYAAREASQQIEIVPPFWDTTWFKLLAAIFLISLFGYFIRRRDQSVKAKAQVKHQMIEAEMKALRAQMNPHFIFNCLNSINRYIVKNDVLAASRYLTKFSKLIRLILDTSSSETIPLDKEIQMLQLYITMELLRFTNSFEYYIQVKEPLKPEEVMIPSMIIQPFIENAIWHGLLHKEGGVATLIVSFLLLDARTLQVMVEDNGIGRAKAQEMKSKEATRRKSYGMRISNDRLQLINDLHGRSASVEVIDLERGGSATGTRVILIIPIQKKHNDND